MYQLTSNPGIIQRLSDGAFIPTSEDNRDFAEYQKWLADGNSPAPVPVLPPQVPTVVTPKQARLALLGAGKLAAVGTTIAAMSSPQKEQAQIAWEYAQEFRRDDPLLLAIGAELGLSEEDIDSLFRTAATL